MAWTKLLTAFYGNSYTRRVTCTRRFFIAIYAHRKCIPLLQGRGFPKFPSIHRQIYEQLWTTVHDLSSLLTGITVRPPSCICACFGPLSYTDRSSFLKRHLFMLTFQLFTLNAMSLLRCLREIIPKDRPFCLSSYWHVDDLYIYPQISRLFHRNHRFRKSCTWK